MEAQTAIETVHQVIAYPMAFLLVPLALLTSESSRGHRYFGLVYVGIMTFLYLTGMYMSLTRHEWWTWEFYRNISFNLLGYSMLFYGYRAMYLYRHPQVPRPQQLDRALAVLLTVTVAVVFSVAVFKNTPMRVYAIIGILLVIIEWRELRAGFKPRRILYRRHRRYLLASYIYVLTVASIVHLNMELPRNIKWLWPTLMGSVLLWILTSNHPWIRQHEVRVNRLAIRCVVLVAIGFGGYAMYEIFTGSEVIGDGRM